MNMKQRPEIVRADVIRLKEKITKADPELSQDMWDAKYPILWEFARKHFGQYMTKVPCDDEFMLEPSTATELTVSANQGLLPEENIEIGEEIFTPQEVEIIIALSNPQLMEG
jgi:hypothetical protein